jgi:hypothetical protein
VRDENKRERGGVREAAVWRYTYGGWKDNWYG